MLFTYLTAMRNSDEIIALVRHFVGLGECFLISNWRSVFKIRTSTLLIELVKSIALVRQKKFGLAQ